MQVTEQSAWIEISSLVDIPVDRSDWNLEYHKPKRVSLPRRDILRPHRSCYGVYERNHGFSPKPLRKSWGVYMIAFEDTVLYVGRAAGSENLLSRLGKHRIKLTGSNFGEGVSHGIRWQQYVLKRYSAAPNLIRNDTLVGFLYSFFRVDEPSPEGMRRLEGDVYRGFLARGVTPSLNDPGRIEKREGIKYVRLPSMIVND